MLDVLIVLAGGGGTVVELAMKEPGFAPKERP